MLDSLSTRLQTIFDKLGGRGRLSEENIQEALREVRLALLEADVNFKVVRAFIDRVKDKAVGQDVLTSLTPARQVVKVVHGELVELLGGSGHRLTAATHPPTVIMLMGLQGSGKTTTAAKLARLYSKQGQHPLLAAADTQRPAAMDQLRTLGAQLGVPVTGTAGQTPLEICRAAREEATSRGLTPLILDTAGRLHIDEALLAELQAIRREVAPHHVLLVVDAMTGQDAVTVADKFNQAVGIDAVVLTKMDGDSRGGAAKGRDGESAELDRFDAIIGSMTPGERHSPEVINGSRRQRIARGSGTSVQDVNRLLKQYAQLRKVMKQFKGMEGKLPRSMK